MSDPIRTEAERIAIGIVQNNAWHKAGHTDPWGCCWDGNKLAEVIVDALDALTRAERRGRVAGLEEAIKIAAPYKPVYPRLKDPNELVAMGVVHGIVEELRRRVARVEKEG
mgnify:CR=1 FL=1